MHHRGQPRRVNNGEIFSEAEPRDEDTRQNTNPDRWLSAGGGKHQI